MTTPSNDWNTWAHGVLSGIGAPANNVNLSTLWNWTVAESPSSTPLRWNNPLNTTQHGPGSTAMNPVGVQSFPSLGGGVSATVQTLLNGRYGNIVNSLRGSVPADKWDGGAQAELKTWGTGVAWLHGLLGVSTETATPPPTTATSLPWPLGGSYDPRDLLTRIALILMGLTLILIGLSVAFKAPMRIRQVATLAEVAAI